MANYVMVDFDAVLIPEVTPILPRELLKNHPDLSDVQWDVQSSGTTISDKKAEVLERVWQEHLGDAGLAFAGYPESQDGRGEKRPDRTRREVLRIVRDSTHSRTVKEENDYQCQICGETLHLANGDRYAEAHHVHPLGEGGADIPANIMCVCPNHHALLDYGAIRLDPEKIKGVGGEYMEYHNEKVYEGN